MHGSFSRTHGRGVHAAPTVTSPKSAAAGAGGRVSVVGSQSGEVTTVRHDLEQGETLTVDAVSSEVSADDLDAVVVPGGTVGGSWIDREVQVDQGLVTSRRPDDLPAITAKLVKEVAEGRHEAQARSVCGTARARRPRTPPAARSESNSYRRQDVGGPSSQGRVLLEHGGRHWIRASEPSRVKVALLATAVEQRLQRTLELGDSRANHLPHECEVDPEVPMDEPITHPRHAPPVDLRVGGTKLLRQPLRRFADHL